MPARPFPPPQRSPLWEAKKAEFLEQNPACEACGSTLLVTVHHRVPYHLAPELELDDRNLITLCDAPFRNCHYVFGHNYDWNAYNPLVDIDAHIQRARIETREYAYTPATKKKGILP